MHVSGFFAHIDRNPPAPIYLFKGEADFLMEEAWRKLLDVLVPPKARHFNGERLRAEECAASRAVARLSSLPLFGGTNLLMVRHIEAWPKDQHEAIRAYAQRPYPSACLVLTSSHKKGADKKLEETIASTGMVVDFAPPSEREAPKWLQDRAKRIGKRLSLPAAHLLLSQVGVDLFRMERELEKLGAYVGDRTAIEEQDVREAVGFQRSFTVFELLGYVSKRRSGNAIASLKSLLLAGEAPLPILSLLTRQVRQMWQVKDALGRGLSTQEIAQRLGIPPFVVKGLAEQARSVSDEDFHDIHSKISKADLSLKQTGIPPEIVIEALIVSLCLRNPHTGGR